MSYAEWRRSWDGRFRGREGVTAISATAAMACMTGSAEKSILVYEELCSRTVLRLPVPAVGKGGLYHPRKHHDW